MNYEEREMENMKMFWTAVRTGIIALAAFAIIVIVQTNASYYGAFNKCIEAGKIAGEFPVLGSSRTQFMCLNELPSNMR